MNCKTFTLALIATTLVSYPLMAQNINNRYESIKKMDAASPANMSIQLSVDELEVSKLKKLKEESAEKNTETVDKISNNISEKNVKNENKDASSVVTTLGKIDKDCNAEDI